MLFLLVPNPSLWGQTIAAGPDKVVSGQTGKKTAAGSGFGPPLWQNFSVVDGLAHNSVGSMVEDRTGQLWFGTQGGVSRYDGQTFTNFTTKDGLAGQWIYFILEDRAGQLWFGTTEGGVSRYDGKTFTNFTAQDGLAGQWIYFILEDHSGQLWFGTNGGVSRYDGQTFTNFTTKDGLPDNKVQAMAEDSAGRLWFGTNGGVSRYDGQTFINFTTEDGLPDNNVWAMAENSSGRLWFGTNGGVSRYDGKTFTTLTIEDGLADNRVGYMMEDRSGQLWLGTQGGVSRYDGQTFTTFTAENGLPDNGVRALLEDRLGQLWLGTREGLSRYDGKTFTNFTTKDGLADNKVWSMAEDSAGQLWFGTQGGVSRYDGKTFTNFTTKDGLPNNWVFPIVEDHSGQLWLGTREGLSRYDGKTFTTFTTDDGLAGQWVASMAVDDSGQLWLGTDGGASRYDGQTFTNFTTDDGLPHNWVGSMALDGSGQLWLGTRGGVSRYGGQTFSDTAPWFTTFTVEDGLPDHWVWSIEADRSGQLWFGTAQGGASRYDGTIFQSLLKRDGLISNAVQEILQDRHGTIWIATMGGVNHYRPSHTRPPIHIKDVIADRRYGPVDRVALASSQQFVTFEFLGISYQTRQMAYQYRLEGYDPDWQTTRQQQVTYTDLPVGEYLFQVKGIDRDLNYSQTPATVALEVFYQPVASTLRLAELQLDDLFASFYSTYAQLPLGRATVINDAAQPIEATLRFFLPDFMRRPHEQPLALEPHSTQTVPLFARLDPDLLELEGAVPVRADVGLAFHSDEQTISFEESAEVTLHGRGALTWDSVDKAAAFVTATDPAVTAFARPLLAAFESETAALGQPLQPMLKALVLFQALQQHGVRYLADAVTPYAQVAANRAAIDHIQYPAQTLQHKAGDCDDLTVLYAALLHSAGVPTALVDYPGHIFLLFDSGVDRDQAYRLPLPPRFYVVRGQRLWIPVEITQLHGSFLQAWQTGAEELAKLAPVERIQRIVDTVEAWEQYPATRPKFTHAIVPPRHGALALAFEAQYAELQELIETHLDETYRAPLQLNPDNDALRTELLKVYLGLHQFDTAIRTAQDDLLDRQGNRGRTYNQLGIAFHLKGDLRQAALYFQQALDLHPQAPGVQSNLERTLEALGRAIPDPRPIAAGLPQSDSKATAATVDVDDFYWGD